MSDTVQLADALSASFRHSSRGYHALANEALRRLTPHHWRCVAAPEAKSRAVVVQRMAERKIHAPDAPGTQPSAGSWS